MTVPPTQFISARYVAARDRVWNERLYVFRQVDSVTRFETPHVSEYLIAYTNGDVDDFPGTAVVPIACNRQVADDWMIAVQEQRNT